GRLSKQFAVPLELVPVHFAAFVGRHNYFPFFGLIHPLTVRGSLPSRCAIARVLTPSLLNSKASFLRRRLFCCLQALEQNRALALTSTPGSNQRPQLSH